MEICKGARGKASNLIPLTAGARAGTTPIRRAVAEHRPPLSSPGRLALDRLGAAHLEVLLLIGVATAGRYMTSREEGCCILSIGDKS